MVEHYLGVGLEKGHSADDWSTRPLPHDWLVYAALDVELLIPLRAALVTVLAEAGKTEWAEQEFEAARTAPAGRRRASTLGDARRASIRSAAAASSPRSGRCGTRATSSPPSATSPPGGYCPTRRSSTPRARIRSRSTG